MHLDAAGLLIVNGAMTPAPGIKIRTEFAIGAREQVQIELRGYSRAVVVGALENRFRFFQIDAHEQSAAGPNHGRDFFQKFSRIFRFEISNGRAGKVNNGAISKAATRRQIEGLEVVCTDRKNFERGKFFAKGDRRLGELFARDIYWHISNRCLEIIQQDSRLRSGPRAKSYQFDPAAQRAGYFAAAFAQDPHFRARDVILGKVANFRKEGRTSFVVKKFAGQSARMLRQPGDDLLAKLSIGRLEIKHGDLAGVSVHAASRASRIPVNCQRFSGWKKFR